MSWPDGSTLEIINCHAPSGAHKLTDCQRKTSLRNLLQMNSYSRPGHRIGSACFLIGGNINTKPHALSQLLQMLRQNNVLQTEATVMQSAFGKHGDGCILGGIRAKTLETIAQNHNPHHIPYGIQWSTPLASVASVDSDMSPEPGYTSSDSFDDPGRQGHRMNDVARAS